MSPQVEEINIPVPWGQVRGKWWGPQGKQPIIALHGWQDNAGSFDGLGPLLPPDMAMLAIDFPGHGRSSHYPKGQFYYIFWDGALFLRRLVKHFKWSNIIILGHSMGGAVGFLYASAFPDDVDKLISVDIVSPAIRDCDSITAITGQSIDRFLKYENLPEGSSPCYSKEEMIDLVVDAYQGSVNSESAETLMIRGMAPAPPGRLNLSSTANAQGYLFARDVRLKVVGLGMMSIDLALAYASRIKCQYMNIRGVPGMEFDNPEYYNLVLKKIKESSCHFEYHEVEGNHHLHLTDPEKLVPLIVKFVRTNLPISTNVNGSSPTT